MTLFHTLFRAANKQDPSRVYRGMTTSAPLFALFLALQGSAPAIFTGQLSDRLISESRMIGIELKPATDVKIPGAGPADKVYAATIELFKQPSAPNGLAVALVEGSGGAFLFLDTDLDGRLAESERRPLLAR